MHMIIKQAGVERVSDSAWKEMVKVFKELGLKIEREDIHFECMLE